jgi:phosphoserine phosphatase
MHLLLEGNDVETTALKEIAKAVGASGIEQVRPNVFRLHDAKRVEGIAGLCARHGLDWTFVDDPGPPLSSRP